MERPEGEVAHELREAGGRRARGTHEPGRLRRAFSRGSGVTDSAARASPPPRLCGLVVIAEGRLLSPQRGASAGAKPGLRRDSVGARGMNLEGGSRGGEFGMSSVSCGNGKLRQWLIDQIDSGKYPGLVWENEEKSIFRIPWKHAGKQDYNREEDAALFKVPGRGWEGPGPARRPAPGSGGRSAPRAPGLVRERGGPAAALVTSQRAEPVPRLRGARSPGVRCPSALPPGRGVGQGCASLSLGPSFWNFGYLLASTYRLCLLLARGQLCAPRRSGLVPAPSPRCPASRPLSGQRSPSGSLWSLGASLPLSHCLCVTPSSRVSPWKVFSVSLPSSFSSLSLSGSPLGLSLGVSLCPVCVSLS